MKEVFDLIEAINDGALQYCDEKGVPPTALTVSPGLYRRLVEIKAWEERIGNLVIGCAPLSKIHADSDELCVVIDELFTETGLVVS